MNRRKFVQATTAAMATCAVPLAATAGTNSGHPQSKRSDGKRQLKKSVKWGMVKAGTNVLEKFQIQKELGFDGAELISPSKLDIQQIKNAAQSSQLPVHGLVNMKHWEIRMSSPNPAVRKQAVEIMKTCLQDAKDMGGDSVLLVPGRVTKEDESHDSVWQRSIQCIRQLVGDAERLNVKILIENVWNGFCKQPQELRDYIDEIDHPLVKVYFDIGNARKFAPSEEWIEVLGERIVKLDVKDWGQKNGFCKIGDGDVDWPAVCQALDKLEFKGWCTAEVRGGDEKRLADIAARMDRVLVNH